MGAFFIFRTYAVALVSIFLVARRTVVLSNGWGVGAAMTSATNFDLLDDRRGPGDRAQVGMGRWGFAPN